MRRFIISFITIFLVMGLSSEVKAGRIGNPAATVGGGNTAAEIEYDYSTRDLEGLGIVAEEKSNRILTRVTYGINDRLEGFLKLGAADVEDGEFGFAVGGGAKATLFEQDNLKWGLVGQVLNFTSEAENISDAEEKITEYDIATGISYQFEPMDIERSKLNITPYVGVMGSFVDGEVSVGFLGFTVNADLEEDEAFVVFTGIDFKIDENMCINVEGRFVGEESVAGSFRYLF